MDVYTVISIVEVLVGVVSKVKECYEQRNENREEAKQMSSFVDNLLTSVRMLKDDKFSRIDNPAAASAIAALGRVLQEAQEEAANLLLKLSRWKSMWKPKRIQFALQSLQQRVRDSFQTNLLMASLHMSVSCDQKLQAVLEDKSEREKTALIDKVEKLEMENHMYHELLHWLRRDQGAWRAPEPEPTTPRHPTDHDVPRRGEGSSGRSNLAGRTNSDPMLASLGMILGDWQMGGDIEGCGREEPSEEADLDDLEEYADEEEQPRRLKLSSLKIVRLSNASLTAEYPEQACFTPGALAVQANRACSERIPFYYFEVKVEVMRQGSDIAMGFTRVSSFKNNMLPGLYPDSYGYHGHGGVFMASGRKRVMGYVSGDTVGAGIHFGMQQVFFTKNGELVASDPVDTKGEGLVPTIGLRRPGAKLTVNLGSSRFKREPLPTRLIPRGLAEGAVSIFQDYLTVRHEGLNSHGMVSVQADKPAAYRRQFFYYEILVEDTGSKGRIVLGFTGSRNGTSEQIWVANACGYHGISGKIVANGIELSGARETFTVDDKVGAGIHYRTNQLFFVKNGELVRTLPNPLSGPVFPTIGLQSSQEKVKVIFDQAAFSAEELPWRLVFPARFGGSPVAVVANRPAPFRGAGYYFELRVTDSVRAIGFADREHFLEGELPGTYQHSCGYDGATGMLFTGSKQGLKFGPTAKPGEVLGAGLLYDSNELYFTKDRKVFGWHACNLRSSCALYPTVGMLTGRHAEVNFLAPLPLPST